MRVVVAAIMNRGRRDPLISHFQIGMRATSACRVARSHQMTSHLCLLHTHTHTHTALQIVNASVSKKIPGNTIQLNKLDIYMLMLKVCIFRPARRRRHRVHGYYRYTYIDMVLS